MERLLPARVISSMSLAQVHAISLLALSAAALAVTAPLLIPASFYSASATAAAADGWGNSWLVRFCANLAGYATVLVPLYLVVRLARGWDYDSRGPASGKGSVLAACIRVLAFGDGGGQTGENGNLQPGVMKEQERKQPAAEGRRDTNKQQHQEDQSPYTVQWCIHLTGCFLGLQAAYLTWGVLQERMMTYDYAEAGAPTERFRDSQFLVFANRALGGLLAVPLMLTAAAGGHRRPGQQSSPAAPAFEYAYSSLSNILSSWFQYEALVYVTFPTQVLAKASKIIPVMLMGKLVSRKSYRLDEYFTSGLISAGTALFLLSSNDADSTQQQQRDSGGGPSAAISGVCLLTGYLIFDAFTSSWQSRVFVQYRVTSLQMMAGSSLLSCLVTVAAQLQQGSLSAALAFTMRHPLFSVHLAMLSLCSTLGQLVIFHTIDRFGPVTFIIIMTVRQAFAILISCLVYQHRLSGNAWLGVVAVFGAMFLRIYFAHRAQRRR